MFRYGVAHESPSALSPPWLFPTHLDLSGMPSENTSEHSEPTPARHSSSSLKPASSQRGGAAPTPRYLKFEKPPCRLGRLRTRLGHAAGRGE